MDRYDSYKDSGVKWLGEIPKHWEVVKVKHLFKICRGRVIAADQMNEEGMYPVYSSQTENNGCMGFISSYDFEGDLLTWTTDGAKAGTVFKRSGKFNCTNVCGVLSPITINNLNYLYYAIYLSAYYNKRVDILGFKIMSNEMAELKFPLPLKEEQEAIANYLDAATSKIDEAIAQQQKMIDLLNERKQIIINNAITKGLDPNVKMKPSGVDWIGDIPEHWELRKLGTIGSTINGVSHDSSYFGEGYPFVSYSDVYKNYSLPKFVSGLAKSSKQERRFFSVERGDVFFTRTSETAEEIGFTSTCIETIHNAVFAGFLIRFRPNVDLLDPNFSKYYFRAHIHRSYFVKEMNLVIRASLSQQLLKGLPILLPSLQEQCAIASYLDGKINEIDLCLKNKIKQIFLLQERKQIIINDVVTGKVKVV